MSPPTDRIDFTAEIERCRSKLMAYILAIVRDYHLAEDVYQETLLAAVQAANGFGEIRHPLALAREMARRRALAALRERNRHIAIPSEEMLDLLDRACEQEMDLPETPVEALEPCIKELPVTWQRIVKMRYWDGLSVHEIAGKLNRSASAVSVALHRIRGRLSESLAQNNPRPRRK